LHDKNNLLPDETPKTKEVKEIEAESVSYVVCQKYGIETGDNSFGYLASWSGHNMDEIKASLDSIRKEANSLINAIDDRFSAICKERGIDLTQTEQAQPEQPAPAKPVPAAEKPVEPTFTTETRTETIAGVDFEFQEVVTEAAKEPTEVTQSDPIHEFAADYHQYILDAYRNGVPRDSPAQVESDILGLADILRNGKTENFREAIERAGNNSGTQDRAAALLQRLDELIPQAVTAEHTAQSADPAELLPDPTISVIDRDSFGYTAEDMLPLNQDRAVELFNQDITVYLLYPDNSEAMAFDVDEIKAHDGIFGIEREEWLNSKENQVLTAESLPPVEIAAKELPPSVPPPAEETPETPKNETPIYPQSVDYARDNGELDAWRESRALNVECGNAIDQAVTDSNYELYRYDLKSAVKNVIDEYGADRVAWVLAGNINYHDWDGRLSNTNKAWAKEFETPDPDVYLQTHLAILDGVANRFREAVKELPPPAVNLEESKALPPIDTAEKPNPVTPQPTPDTLNALCVKSIDQAIIDCNIEPQTYDLKTAARNVIAEYGAERVTEALASCSKESKTHPKLLEGFSKHFEEVKKEKPSLFSTLKSGEEKSKREFGNAPLSEAPKKSTNKEEL
jgi:hypothetical protein